MKMKRLFLLVALAAATLSLSAQHNMQVWEGALYSEFATTVVDSVTFLASPTGTPKPTGIVHDTIVKEVHDTITIIQVVHDTVYNYAVVLTPSAYGTITADKTGAVAGEKITLAVTPATGYELEAITVKDAENNDIPVTDNSTFTMPASIVTVTATFKLRIFTVTTTAEHGTIEADKTEATLGETVTLTITPATGYELEAITVKDANDTDIAVTDNSTFIMPASNVTVTATFKLRIFTVTTTAEHGTIAADKKGATYGETVTLTVTPATGYELEAITVKDANDTDIAVTDNSTFIMPASNVTVSATFRKIDYTITIASCENGYVTASSTAQMGDEVTLTLSSNAYYIPKTISVLQGETPVTTTAVEDTTTQYTFTMPAGNVTITAVFEKVASAFTPAAFSVDEGTRIAFSQGNLQCSGLTTNDTTWSFADYQTEMLGTANVSDDALADKIDLFGWSGSTGAKWGISTSTNDADYSGDFVDWGENTIGTNAQNTYRSLTYEEWEYLFKYRTDAAKKQGVARIYLNNDGTEYANGLVLLPDNWDCPADLTFKSGFSDTRSVQAYADYQTFTLSDWQRLEAAGAVFLPALGYLYGSDVYDVQYYGSYWSATPLPYGTRDAAEVNFRSNHVTIEFYTRNTGRAVRLVKDL